MELLEVKKLIIGEKNGTIKRTVKSETELIRLDKIETARPYIKNDADVDKIDGDVTVIIMESISTNKDGSKGIFKIHVNESYTSLKKRIKDAGITVCELAG